MSTETTTTPVFNTPEDLVTYEGYLPPEIDQRCLDAIDSAAEENGTTIVFIACALHQIETILRESTNPELVDTGDFADWLDGWLEDWDEYIREQCTADEEDDEEALAAVDDDLDLERVLAEVDNELHDEALARESYYDN